MTQNKAVDEQVALAKNPLKLALSAIQSVQAEPEDKALGLVADRLAIAAECIRTEESSRWVAEYRHPDGFRVIHRPFSHPHGTREDVLRFATGLRPYNGEVRIFSLAEWFAIYSEPSDDGYFKAAIAPAERLDSRG